MSVNRLYFKTIHMANSEYAVFVVNSTVDDLGYFSYPHKLQNKIPAYRYDKRVFTRTESIECLIS